VDVNKVLQLPVLVLALKGIHDVLCRAVLSGWGVVSTPPAQEGRHPVNSGPAGESSHYCCNTQTAL